MTKRLLVVVVAVATGAAAPRPPLDLDEADSIVRKAYAESYARMPPCREEDVEKDCLAHVVAQLQRRNGTTATDALAAAQAPTTSEFQLPHDHPFPWWFQTLLRDLPTNGAYGWWHHFSTVAADPPGLRFCAIGKNGSTEWRKVFRELNYPELCEGRPFSFGEGECRSGFRTKTALSEDPSATPHAVFLRDPLERLLSGYLDKCAKPNVRRQQGHCAPNAIFGVDHLQWKATRPQRRQGRRPRPRREEGEGEGEVPPDLTHVLQDMEKEMFAAYVDLLPLEWNVHFVPQSISCDLYRRIGDYDVFAMGRQFMSELDRMAARFSGRLPEALDGIFRYRAALRNDTSNLGLDNAHGTKAPAKVTRYYSARSVRRALEYFSIDYVALGLQVPKWAREMLRKDVLI